MQACTVPKLWILQIPERLMLELSLVFASLLNGESQHCRVLMRTHAEIFIPVYTNGIGAIIHNLYQFI